MRFKAIHRYVRISPRKARYVMDMVRSKSANEALEILKCTHKRASFFIGKVLKSAIANAQDTGGIEAKKLSVVEARVDGGPTLKRFRAGPMGRAMRIRKRTSHITIILGEIKGKEKD